MRNAQCAISAGNLQQPKHCVTVCRAPFLVGTERIYKENRLTLGRYGPGKGMRHIRVLISNLIETEMH